MVIIHYGRDYDSFLSHYDDSFHAHGYDHDHDHDHNTHVHHGYDDDDVHFDPIIFHDYDELKQCLHDLIAYL